MNISDHDQEMIRKLQAQLSEAKANHAKAIQAGNVQTTLKAAGDIAHIEKLLRMYR